MASLQRARAGGRQLEVIPMSAASSVPTNVDVLGRDVWSQLLSALPGERSAEALERWLLDRIASREDLASCRELWDLGKLARPHARAALGDESVCAFGTENREAAELYAALTGRRLRVLQSIDEMAEVDDPSVVIATWSQLRTTDLEAIYEVSTRRAPVGLMVANSHAELADLLLVSAALVNRCHASDELPMLPASAVIADASIDAARTVFDRVTGHNAKSSAVRELLAGPSSILGFLGHSDGVDARLSSRAVLCARVDAGTSRVHLAPPNCDVTGYCHRRHLSRPDALATGDLISPRTIFARVVFLVSCYIGRSADCSVHPADGLLAQMLRTAGIGAVIAPWEVSFGKLTEMLSVSTALSEGHTVGEALADFYRTAPGVLNGCNRFLLFGDPAVRAAGTAPPAPSPAELSATFAHVDRPSSVAPRATGETDRGEDVVAWLRERLVKIEGERQLNVYGDLRVSDEALARARSALAVLETGGTADESVYEALLRAVVAHEGSMHMHWHHLEMPQFVDRATVCFGCGRPGRLFRVRGRHTSRWLATCTPCDSFYADVPEGSELVDAQFDFTEARDVRHTLPAGTRAILVHLRSSLEIRTTWRLGASFDFSALPPGRSWLWLHTLSEDGIFSYSRMVDNRPVR